MPAWVLAILIIVAALVLGLVVVMLFLAYAVKKGVESDGTVYADVENRVSLLEADMGRVLEKLGMKSVTAEQDEEEAEEPGPASGGKPGD